VVEGYRVYVEVRDSGIGMDNGTLARVFDPFFTTKFTGRGLGMAAVLGIVRGHKGAIKIASQQNSGTTVTVMFPPAEEIGAPEPEPTPKAAVHIEESRTVLVIDDEEAVRAVTGAMLERSGFTVLLAEDGEAGIELYRHNAPDIVAVLLDLTMPHMTGDQVFAELRDINPNARVILMSGFDQKEATKRFGSDGLAGFLQKPFPAKVLRERLATVSATP
jgi:CheY-like chemotaxis protein